jgi:uncharacterized membrane protein YjgN (DUF898 family)
VDTITVPDEPAPFLRADPLLRYDGRLGDLYRIFLINFALALITFGIWHFWGATRMRRYLWSRTSFRGTRLEYTGTGRELFLGWLALIAAFAGLEIASVIVGVILGLVHPALGVIPLVAFILIILVAIGAAPFAAQRYRLSRTNWRGIRGAMQGSAFAYGLRSTCYFLLTLVTLTQSRPWVQVRLSERLINASSLGNLPARCEARARGTYPAYLGGFLCLALVGALLGIMAAPQFLAVLHPQTPALRMVGLLRLQSFVFVAVLLLGLIGPIAMSFYHAAMMREVFGYTVLGPLRLSSSVTGWRLIGLRLGNMALLVCTLGFGYPMVLHRNVRFTTSNILASGVLDPSLIAQLPLPSSMGILSQFDNAAAS